MQEGSIIIHGVGIGTVSRGMIRERAAELAVINGREPQEVSKSDWDEAKRELSGGNDTDPKQAILESAPESERWNPIPGSPGHEAMVNFDDNEDEDGRCVGERLFEAGVEEAGHDQMLEAATRSLFEDD